MTIYQLESLRIKNLSIDYLCGYLIDDRLQKPEIYPIAESIIESIFKEALRGKYYRYISTEKLKDHTISLLVFAAHRVSSVRKFAASLIPIILQVLPHLLFQHDVVTCMLDLLRFLDNEKIGHKEEHLSHFEGKLTFITRVEAHESAMDYFKLCQEWINLALQMSTSETIPLLQNYISEISFISPWIGTRQSEYHNTSVLQDDISSSFLMQLFQQFYADSSTSSSMIRHSNRRIKVLGEVRGLIEGTLNCQNRISVGDAERSLAMKRLSKTFANDLRSIYRDPESPHFLSKLYQALSNCAALVLINDSVLFKLLLLILY